MIAQPLQSKDDLPLQRYCIFGNAFGVPKNVQMGLTQQAVKL